MKYEWTETAQHLDLPLFYRGTEPCRGAEEKRSRRRRPGRGSISG